VHKIIDEALDTIESEDEGTLALISNCLTSPESLCKAFALFTKQLQRKRFNCAAANWNEFDRDSIYRQMCRSISF
jgi:hypothetical protein